VEVWIGARAEALIGINRGGYARGARAQAA
jgi:hypothetical protein